MSVTGISAKEKKNPTPRKEKGEKLRVKPRTEEHNLK
jgi:hypothetical protein